MQLAIQGAYKGWEQLHVPSPHVSLSRQTGLGVLPRELDIISITSNITHKALFH